MGSNRKLYTRGNWDTTGGGVKLIVGKIERGARDPKKRWAGETRSFTIGNSE